MNNGLTMIRPTSAMWTVFVAHMLNIMKNMEKKMSETIQQKFTEVLGTEIQTKYQAGLCHALAIELKQIIPNSKVVAVLDHDLDIDEEVLTHAFIEHNGNYIDVTGIYRDVNDILEMYEDHGEQYLSSAMSAKELYDLGGYTQGPEVLETKIVAKRIASIYLDILRQALG